MVARRTTRLAGRIARALRRIALGLALSALALTLAYRWIDPPLTWLMLTERMRLGAVERGWIPLSAMSPDLPLAP